MIYRSKGLSYILILALILSAIPISDNYSYAAGPPEITKMVLEAITTVEGEQTLRYKIYGKNFDNPTFWVDGIPVSSDQYEFIDGAYLITRTEDNNEFFEGDKTHKFSVQNNDGTESIEEKDFTVPVIPWVTSISSSKVNIGDPLTVYGTGLDDAKYPVEKVIIGGNPYTESDPTYEFRIDTSDNQPKIIIDSVQPAQFPRNGDVKIVKSVTEEDGTVHEIQGIYKNSISVVGKLEGVEVERIEPNAGPVTGGTTIRILGKSGFSEFTSDMKIYIDKVADENKLEEIQLVNDENTEEVTGIQGLTPSSPTGSQGIFNVIITDNTGANEEIVVNGFTYEDKDNLLKLSTISPPYGKGGSSEPVEITGRNIITLNTPNLVEWTVSDAVYENGSYFDFDKYALITNYTGKYRISEEAEEDNVKITRETKLILGKSTEISIDNYSPGLDKISAKVPIVGDPGLATVTIQTFTSVRDKETDELFFTRSEEFNLENGFTFLSATTDPIINSIEPEKGPIDDKIYLTIKGDNFQVVNEPNPDFDSGIPEGPDNPKTITKYPVIRIGNKTIDPNTIDADDIDEGFTENPDWMKVYDNENNEVNGVGRTVGNVIKTVIPSHGDQTKVGIVDVNLTNPDLGQIFMDNIFEFTKHERTDNLPEITNIKPNMGPIEGGNEITIEGNNFQHKEIKPDVIVTIDGAKAEILDATSTKIKVRVPEGITIGDKTVQVITEDGAIATMEKGYTYIRLVSEPEIESVSPAFGGKGTVVYIFGKDKGPENPNFFAPDPQGARIEDKMGTRVFLNDIDVNDKEEYDDDGNLIEGSVYNKDENGEIIADGDGNVFLDKSRVEVIDGNTIRVVIPGGYSPGLKEIKIINPDTSTAIVPNGFNYKIPPQGLELKIDDIIPDYGSHKGGMYITIEGENFKDGAKVFFGGKEASEVVVSGSRDRIVLRTPEYILPDPDIEPSRIVDVTVVNYDGSNITSSPQYDVDGKYINGGFTYMVPESEPFIDKIEASDGTSTGTTIGNEYVSVIGKDFRKYYDTETEKYKYPRVYFGGKEALEVKYIGDTELYVKTPFYGDEGSVDVTVINPDAGTYVKTNGFTYEMVKPVIEDVTPAKGSKKGGQEITVRGKEMLQGDFSEELIGEKLDGKDPTINVLAIFGDEKDEAKVILDSAENILGDIKVNYEKGRENVELHSGEIVEEANLTISHKDIEKPIRAYEINPDERHLFLVDWQPILDQEIGVEGILVELRDSKLITKRRIAPRAEVLDAEIGETRTVIVQTPPAFTVGKKNLYIENKDRGFASTTFEYTNPNSDPIIEQITPSREHKNSDGEVTKHLVESTVEGGLYITIEGYDFRQNVEVFIGDKPAPLVSRVVLSEEDAEGRLKSRIVVRSPEGDSKLLGEELRMLVVNQDGGFADSTLNLVNQIPFVFKYVIPESEPYIQSILPGETSQAGGNKVTIIGYDFRTEATVVIGGRECAVDPETPIKSDKIVVITPTDLTPGIKDVQIINVDHGTVTKSSGIKVISYPQITSYTTQGGGSINRVSIEGGEKILLSGKNFQEGAKVYFGGTRNSIEDSEDSNTKGLSSDDNYYSLEGSISSPRVEFQNENELLVTVPEVFTEGDYTITIINADGGISDGDDTIEYRAPIPGDPINLEVEIVNDKYIRLYNYSSKNVDYYEIYTYLGDDYPDDRDFKLLETTKKTSYRITKFKEIDKSEDIYFRIRAVNKYGPSGWSDIVKLDYYHDDLDEIDQIGDDDTDGDLISERQESISSDKVNVTLGNRDFRDNTSRLYIIDLKDRKYSKINKRTINIPGRIINESNRPILVDNGDTRLQFSPRIFFTYNFYNMSKDDQRKSYGTISVEKYSGSHADFIERKVPRRYKLISSIYNVDTGLETDNKASKITKTSTPIDIEIIYDKNKLRNQDESKLQVYRYDPQQDKWEPSPGGLRKTNNAVYARVQAPGNYAILGER